ncbi:MAG: hypothetical protein IGR80_01525 [Synechococcales cyanobacterium K44_A2020_017]|nr:hypothetical protein [Synechococcales cyanobacterium K32_A2020_035]MBF2093422.1 hypothetical protein [Synechococcales cyanobacterium K44_A2020_017]
MNDYQERRNLIRKSLKIQPMSHGQVHIFTVGMRSRPDITSDRYEELRLSLSNHGSNLIPIMVRRSDRLGDEKEYEVIHGADWVIVAEDLGVEMLWAWVFDLTDEQVDVACQEWDMLMNASDPVTDPPTVSPTPTAASGLSLADMSRLLEQTLDQKLGSSSTGLSLDDVSRLLDQKLDQKLDQGLGSLSGQPQSSSHLDDRIDSLSNLVESLANTVQTLTQQVGIPVSPHDSSDAARAMVESIERSVTHLCNQVTQGASITLSIQPPSTINPQEALLRDLYSELTVPKLKTRAKTLGLPIKTGDKKPELINALIAWHSAQGSAGGA